MTPRQSDFFGEDNVMPEQARMGRSFLSSRTERPRAERFDPTKVVESPENDLENAFVQAARTMAAAINAAIAASHAPAQAAQQSKPDAPRPEDVLNLIQQVFSVRSQSPGHDTVGIPAPKKPRKEYVRTAPPQKRDALGHYTSKLVTPHVKITKITAKQKVKKYTTKKKGKR